MRLEGIDDRDAALALGKPELWVERRELPALKEGEHYRADLIGFEVVNLQGERLGRVDHFLDMPARRRHGRGRASASAGCRRDGTGSSAWTAGDGRITVDWDAEF